MVYFSDKERGTKPRTIEKVSPAAWGGIGALIESLVSTGAFGHKYPEVCPDERGITGTDAQTFSLALKAEIPDIEWPFKTKRKKPGGLSWDTEPYAPDTLCILDLLQFCYSLVAKPIQRDYHEYFGHFHLGFDIDAGKEEFREKINIILERNGIAFKLNLDGSIERFVPPIIREAISTHFHSGDQILDQMIEDAQKKFINPNPGIRREAVERLWDCWERIKTLEIPDNKKESTNILLNKVSSDPEVRSLIENEARELTEIGNKFHIRHSEITQIRISDSAIIDYLFHRLFSIIQLLLSKR